MLFQAQRQMGTGAAGHPGPRASRAHGTAAGNAATQPRGMEGHPAWGEMSRALPAEPSMAP